MYPKKIVNHNGRNQAIEEMTTEIKKRADVESVAKTMYNAGEKVAGYRQISYDKLPKEDKKVLLLVAKAIAEEFTRGLR